MNTTLPALHQVLHRNFIFALFFRSFIFLSFHHTALQASAAADAHQREGSLCAGEVLRRAVDGGARRHTYRWSRVDRLDAV